MVRIAVAEDEREFRDTCAGFIRRSSIGKWK